MADIYTEAESAPAAQTAADKQALAAELYAAQQRMKDDLLHGRKPTVDPTLAAKYYSGTSTGLATSTGDVRGLFNTGSALYGGGADAARANVANIQQSASDQIAAGSLASQQALGAINNSNNYIANAADSARDQYAYTINDAGMGQQRGATLGAQGYYGINGVAGPALTGQAIEQDQARQLSQFADQGPGPSMAQAQLAQARDANMAQAIALGASGRGAGVSGAAQAQAQAQALGANSQAAGQAATLRAQEETAWRAQQIQARQAAAGIGASIQGENLQGSQFILGREQAAQQAQMQGEALAQQYSQQNAAARAASAQAYINQAQLQQANATTAANTYMTYGAQQQAALQAATQAQQNQLNTEAQLRVNGVLQAQGIYAGQKSQALQLQAQQNAADAATTGALVGAGGMIVGGLVGGPAGAAAGGAAGNAAGKAAYSAGNNA